MSAGRLDTLFPLFPFDLRSQLRVDSVGAFSVTDQVTADRVTDIIAAAAKEAVLLVDSDISVSERFAVTGLSDSDHSNEMNTSLLPLTVTDATACSGGNTLSLMRRFAHVQSVELDEDRVTDLRHNVDAVLRHHSHHQEAGPTPGSTRSAVLGTATTFLGDYLELAGSLVQDVVFLDPPWGGPDYVSTDPGGASCLQDLFLGEVPVSSLCRGLLASKRAALVALRLPSRLTVDAFMQSVVSPTPSGGDSVLSHHLLRR